MYITQNSASTIEETCLKKAASLWIMSHLIACPPQSHSRAITGCLADKIRVLVTHHIQYIQDANQILVLKNVSSVEGGSCSIIHRRS